MCWTSIYELPRTAWCERCGRDDPEWSVSGAKSGQSGGGLEPLDSNADSNILVEDGDLNEL